MWVLLGIVVIHITILACIFDIYLNPTRVVTPQAYVSPIPAPAKRVVMFITDGLAADKLFVQNPIDLDNPIAHDRGVTYMKHLTEQEGVWGVSYTKYPRVVRPDLGLLTIFSGYIEPEVINFFPSTLQTMDTTLNLSRQAWCWNPADIGVLIPKGSDKYITSYSNEQLHSNIHVDNSTQMDTWVFKEVDKFLSNCKTNSSAFQNKTLFVITLPGTSIGIHMPGIELPLGVTLSNLDKGIAQTVQSFEKLFRQDRKTAYIFTSMHGDLAMNEERPRSQVSVETPIIAWGAGIKHPHSIWCERNDIDQVDIAVMVATLLGIPIPRNSMGTLSEAYLDLPKHDLSRAFLTNARQMVAQFNSKEEIMKGRISYKPWKDVTQQKLLHRIDFVQHLINQQAHDAAIEESKKIICDARFGFEYLNKYDEPMLHAALNVTLVAWIIILLEMVLRQSCIYSDLDDKDVRICTEQQRRTFVIAAYVIIFICASYTCYLLYVAALPLSYYFYCCLPQLMLASIISNSGTWCRAFQIFSSMGNGCRFRVLSMIFAIWLSINLMALVFFKALLLTIGLLILGILPITTQHKPLPKMLVLRWITSTLTLSLFPLMVVLNTDFNHKSALPIGALLWIISGFALVFKISPATRPTDNYVVYFQPWFLFLIFAFVLISDFSVIPTQYVETMRYVAWMLFGVSLWLPLFASMMIVQRYCHIALAIAGPYLLLSSSFEPIFLLLFAFHLYTWIEMENAMLANCSGKTLIDSTAAFGEIYTPVLPELNTHSFDLTVQIIEERPISKDDFRRALYCFFFVLLAIFGTERFESGTYMFDGRLVNCFVNMYSRHLQPIVLMCKTMLPITLVGVTFRGVNLITRTSHRKSLYIIVVYAAIMTISILNFLCTKDNSPQDFGIVLTNFVAVQVMVFYFVLVYIIAILYTSISFKDSSMMFVIARASFKQS